MRLLPHQPPALLPRLLRATGVIMGLPLLVCSCLPGMADGGGDGGLRPNVQNGAIPNAVGQTPAFPDQTRAPQPAEATAFEVEEVASGLDSPWGIAVLPGGRVLVTERPGRLRWIDTDGSVSAPIDGVPDASASGQGGMLDVAVSPTFAADRHVFLSFSEARGDGLRATSIARGTLAEDLSRLDDVVVIYRQQPAWDGTRHFGSRLVFDDAGALFATFGDRGSAWDDAQDPGNAIGAVIRILPDGTIPADNPFGDGPLPDGTEGAPETWSWGHRNIQSATLGTDGALWTVEHGPAGGDELNRPDPGVNHGWPVISYGEDYSGSPVGDGLTEQEGMAQPVYFWDPVIAPSGMATYEGDLFDGWEGDLLVGGLRALSVVRLSLREGRVHTEEWLNIGRRVRDIAIAADGAVLIIVDEGDAPLLRLVPAR